MSTEPFPGMEIRFPDGCVKLLKKYPGVWRCQVTMYGDRPRSVRKTIEDRRIAEWIATDERVDPDLEQPKAIDPMCKDGCYMFGPEEAPCEASSCRLKASSERDRIDTRRQWNERGRCALVACQSEDEALGERYMRHPTTGLLYCESCSLLVAEAQGIVMELG